jgi:hypothetical protein
MLDLIRNSQLYGFNNYSSIGNICVAKFEEEKGQITGYWYCYENLCCVQYNKPSSRK